MIIMILIIYEFFENSILYYYREDFLALVCNHVFMGHFISFFFIKLKIILFFFYLTK